MIEYFNLDDSCCQVPRRVEIDIPPGPGDDEEADGVPVTVNFVKSHLRIDTAITQFDDLLIAYIEAATQKIQDFTRFTLINTTYAGYYNCFPDCMRLVYRPGLSVSSITYIDTNGDEQTLDAAGYNIYTDQFESIICPESSWPATACDTPDAVTVTFEVGYGHDSSDSPADFKLALAQIVSFMLGNNGDCTDQCVSAACRGMVTISNRLDIRPLGGC